MKFVCMQIVVVALMLTESGSAIKCFICDSSVDKECTDLKTKSGIVAETCTLESMRTANTWLFDLNKIAYLNNTPELKNVPMNCQKVVGRRQGESEMVTARFCQLDTRETDACSILTEKLADSEDEILHCSICENDKCNGAVAMNVSSAWLGLFLFAAVRLLYGKEMR